MAPSYRGSVPAIAADENGVMGFGRDDERQRQRSMMWDRRRKRLEKKKDVDDKDLGELKKNQNRSQSRHAIDDEDLDPYDSDPGESYREHCMKINGIGAKSCLPVPIFLKNKRLLAGEGETVLTAPPSPLQSEMGDLFGQIPASLPPNMQRVRYSLRSSITDGSEKQPTGPTVMERRELRPNNIHLNVSHWSDTGGRPYMEDR